MVSTGNKCVYIDGKASDQRYYRPRLRNPFDKTIQKRLSHYILSELTLGKITRELSHTHTHTFSPSLPPCRCIYPTLYKNKFLSGSKSSRETFSVSVGTDRSVVTEEGLSRVKKVKRSFHLEEKKPRPA